MEQLSKNSFTQFFLKSKGESIMDNQIGRRTLVVGGPTMLLLSACGGGEDDQQSIVSSQFEEMDSIQSAMMDSYEEPEEIRKLGGNDKFASKLEDFADFYKGKYVYHMRAQAAGALFAIYKTYKGTKFDFYQIYENHYGCIDKDVIPSIIANSVYGYKDIEVSVFRMSEPKMTNPPPGSGYTRDMWLNWYNFFSGLNHTELNDIFQHRKLLEFRVKIFMRSWEKGYTEFLSKVAEADKHHKRRLEKGDVEDDVVPVYEGTGANKKVVTNHLRLGDKRKPVDRGDLGYNGTLLESLCLGEAEANATTLKLLGRNSTKVVGVIPSQSNTLYTTTSYLKQVGDDQLEAIANYAQQDVKKNGPLNRYISEKESVDWIRRLSEQAVRVTGFTYESYIIGQYFARGLGQGVVGCIRYGFATAKPNAQPMEKGFDVIQMLQFTVDTALDDPALRTHIKRNQGILYHGLMAVAAFVSLTTIFYWYGRYEANSVVKENPDDKPLSLGVKFRKEMLEWFPGLVVPVSQFTAIGFTMRGATTLTAYTDNWKFIPSVTFGVSDIASGTADIIAVSKNGEYNTAEGALHLASGILRVGSGLWSGMVAIDTMAGWGRTTTTAGLTIFKPINVATAASAFSFGVFVLRGILQSTYR